MTAKTERPIPDSELEAVRQQQDAIEAKLRELQARLAALQRHPPAPVED